MCFSWMRAVRQCYLVNTLWMLFTQSESLTRWNQVDSIDTVDSTVHCDSFGQFSIPTHQRPFEVEPHSMYGTSGSLSLSLERQSLNAFRFSLFRTVQQCSLFKFWIWDFECKNWIPFCLYANVRTGNLQVATVLSLGGTIPSILYLVQLNYIAYTIVYSVFTV